jgi:hypothetical protein
MRLTILFALAAACASARSVRVLYVDAPEDAPGSLHLVVGKEVSKVDVPRLAISSGQVKVPSSALRLRLAEKPPTREQPLPAEAPAVDLPAGVNDILLVLFPLGKPGPLGFRAQAIDFSPARIPDGGILWLNLTRRGLRARLGSATTVVGPGQVRAMEPGASPGGTYSVLVDLVAAEAGEEPLPLLRATWIRESGRRQLLFVLDDPDRTVPRVVAVPHRLPPPPEPPGKSTGP